MNRLRATFVLLLFVMTVLCVSRNAHAAEDEDGGAGEQSNAKWGQWAPADKGLTAVDLRMGLHLTHVTIGDTAVGSGKRGGDYGFRAPAVYMPELAFSAFTSKHLSFGMVMQPVSFGSQDAPVLLQKTERHTRSPMVMGIGAIVEAGYSAGPFLFRPGLATGPRVVMLLEDRSGKQSPPVAAQWFMHARFATEIEVSRSFAIGIGASTDVLRPLDWGAFSYLVWRFNDVHGATR